MASLLFFEEKMGFQLKRQLLTLRNYLNASFYSLFSKKLPENKQKKEVVLFFFFDFNLHQFEEEKIIFLFFFLSKKLALFALKTLKKKTMRLFDKEKKCQYLPILPFRVCLFLLCFLLQTAVAAFLDTLHHVLNLLWLQHLHGA